MHAGDSNPRKQSGIADGTSCSHIKPTSNVWPVQNTVFDQTEIGEF